LGYNGDFGSGSVHSSATSAAVGLQERGRLLASLIGIIDELLLFESRRVIVDWDLLRSDDLGMLGDGTDEYGTVGVDVKGVVERADARHAIDVEIITA